MSSAALATPESGAQRTPPILREVPARIETARLVLRCPRNDDGAALYAAVVESLADLRPWAASMPWAMLEPSPDLWAAFCRESQAQFIRRSGFFLVAFHKHGNQLVGAASLHNGDWTVPKFELGYWCRSSLHRNGFATEAAAAVASFAFDELGAQRVYCTPDELNYGSRRVCENTGFALEGTLKNDRLGVQGELRSTCIYARTG